LLLEQEECHWVNPLDDRDIQHAEALLVDWVQSGSILNQECDCLQLALGYGPHECSAAIRRRLLDICAVLQQQENDRFMAEPARTADRIRSTIVQGCLGHLWVLLKELFAFLVVVLEDGFKEALTELGLLLVSHFDFQLEL
jgi:hypothetical protein